MTTKVTFADRREHDARNKAQLRGLITELLEPATFALLPPRSQDTIRQMAVRLGIVGPA